MWEWQKIKSVGILEVVGISFNVLSVQRQQGEPNGSVWIHSPEDVGFELLKSFNRKVEVLIIKIKVFVEAKKIMNLEL